MARGRKRAAIRFSSDILARLGEELNPEIDQGLLELVRNAWDADAKTCTVTLTGVSEAGGSITVEDDGDGMSVDDIVNGWLVLGSSGKQERRQTSEGRLVIGDKGLGRLAALRLGHVADMYTRERDAGVEHQVTVDWDRFQQGKVVEDVPIDVTTIATEASHGTKIVLRNLREPITEARVRRIARDLILLSDPFDANAKFRPVLKAKEYRDLARTVRKRGYFAAADWRLVANVEDGQASIRLFDGNGREVATASHDEIRRKNARSKLTNRPDFHCPDATFELWAFRLGGGPRPGFTPRHGVNLGDLRSWLTSVGGVHLYHRGLRVRPFGDPGDDWLGLNRARASLQEEAVSTNNSLGRVTVRDEDEALRPKTDRVGFVETSTFEDLKLFATESLRWFQRYRQAQADQRRKSEKAMQEADQETQRAVTDRIVAALPEAQRVELEQVVRAERQVGASYAAHLREEILLYRSLATVGSATVLYAHEWYKPALLMQDLLREIEQTIREEGTAPELALSPLLTEMKVVSDGLVAYTKLPLSLMKAEKRRRQTFHVGQVVSETEDLLAYPLLKSKVKLEKAIAVFDDQALGVPASLQVAVVNLVINSIQAFVSSHDAVSTREIVLEVCEVEDSLRPIEIRVLDNGPGLDPSVNPTSIWTLGESTSEDGTGIGLTIVRDVADELGGLAWVTSPGRLGGATFVLALPRKA